MVRAPSTFLSPEAHAVFIGSHWGVGDGVGYGSKAISLLSPSGFPSLSAAPTLCSCFQILGHESIRKVDVFSLQYICGRAEWEIFLETSEAQRECQEAID